MQDQKPASFEGAKALMALASTSVTIPAIPDSSPARPKRAQLPDRPPAPGPFVWRVTVPPTRNRAGKVIDVTAPFYVRGLTRHEVAGSAARILFVSVVKRCVPRLPRGTQITRSRSASALVDLRSPRPEFSIRLW